MNTIQEGRGVHLSPTDGQPHHNAKATGCGRCRRLWSEGSTASLGTLGRRQGTHHFLSLAQPYNWPLKASDQMFSERHNSLKLADKWQHTLLSTSPASVSLFLPISLSTGLSVISYCIMKISKFQNFN